MRAPALPRRACGCGRTRAVIAAVVVAPGCQAKRRAALPSLSGWGPGARDEGPVVLPCGAAAAGDRTGPAPEAQVSGDRIPTDHAEELGECFAVDRHDSADGNRLGTIGPSTAN